MIRKLLALITRLAIIPFPDISDQEGELVRLGRTFREIRKLGDSDGYALVVFRGADSSRKIVIRRGSIAKGEGIHGIDQANSFS